MSIQRPKVFWPVTVTAGVNDKIDINLGGVTVATIAAGTYYSVDLFLVAVQAALDTALGDSGLQLTVSDTTGLITFTDAGSNFTLLFSTGANAATSARSLLGFYPADFASTALTLTAPYQHSNGWYSPTPFKFDSRDFYEEPNSVLTLSVSGKVKVVREPVLTVRTIDFHFLPKTSTRIADQVSPTYGHEAIEHWWRNGAGRFRLWPDATVEATSGDYAFDSSVLTDGFVPERQYPTREFYRVGPWKIRSYV